MQVLDLFSGAGGLSIGFEQAGFDIVGAVERISVYAKTHELNFPTCTTITSDVSELTAEKFKQQTGIQTADIDVIIGGPPCQTFSTIGASKIESVSGKELKEDPRNYLFRNYFEYVKFYNPQFFVLENVPNLRTKYGGKLFANMLTLSEELGYRPFPTVLNAMNYGVPQSRKRLFLVGVKPGLQFEFPKPTHADESSKQMALLNDSTKLLQPRTVADALGDLPDIFDGIRAGLLPYSRNDDLSDYQTSLRNSHGQVGNNICRVSNERAKRLFPHMKQGAKYMDLPPEVRAILPFREDIFHDRLKRLVWDKPSWTVIAHIGMDGYMYIHPTENRTLSVREAARIQSFPDSFEFTGNMREQYIQVGNAVPPLLARKIAEACMKSLVSYKLAEAI